MPYRKSLQKLGCLPAKFSWIGCLVRKDPKLHMGGQIGNIKKLKIEN